MPAKPLSLRDGLLALAVMAVWGTNFVVIRFGLDDLPPLLFALTMLLTNRDVEAERWSAGGVELTTRHFHWLLTAILITDLVFVLPHRLLTTYGGF